MCLGAFQVFELKIAKINTGVELWIIHEEWEIITGSKHDGISYSGGVGRLSQRNNPIPVETVE